MSGTVEALLTVRDPVVCIERVPIGGTEWWTATAILGHCEVTSGYWRRRPTAIRKLKEKLAQLEADIAFCKGFLP